MIDASESSVIGSVVVFPCHTHSSSRVAYKDDVYSGTVYNLSHCIVISSKHGNLVTLALHFD